LAVKPPVTPPGVQLYKHTPNTTRIDELLKNGLEYVESRD
jgi:hypothetical protein